MMKKNDWRGFIWTTKEHQLPELKKIFEEMWDYYGLYLEKAEDLPYWSTEMDLVGKVAMSAARLNHPAALEFLSEELRKRRLRRADLWLGFKSDHGLLVEAKRDWVLIKSKLETKTIKDYIKDAENYLSKMVKDLKGLKEKPSWLGSFFFAQIYMSPNDIRNYASLKDDLIKKGIKMSKKPDNRISFIAYYFLPREKFSKRKYRCKENYYYPGIIFLGRIRRFSKNA